MFLSAGDLPVIREVLQHTYYSLVEQVKRKVPKFYREKLNCWLCSIHIGKSVGSRFGEMMNLKKYKHETSKFRSGVGFILCPHQSRLCVEVAILNTVFTVKNWA